MSFSLGIFGYRIINIQEKFFILIFLLKYLYFIHISVCFRIPKKIRLEFINNNDAHDFFCHILFQLFHKLLFIITNITALRTNFIVKIIIKKMNQTRKQKIILS